MIVLSAVNVVVPLFMKSLDVPLAEFVSPVARSASNDSVPLFVKLVWVAISAFIVNNPAFVPPVLLSTNTEPTVSATPAINVESLYTWTANVSASVPFEVVWNVPPVTFSPPVNVWAFDILNVPVPVFSTEPAPAIFPANVDVPLWLIFRLLGIVVVPLM